MIEVHILFVTEGDFEGEDYKFTTSVVATYASKEKAVKKMRELSEGKDGLRDLEYHIETHMVEV